MAAAPFDLDTDPRLFLHRSDNLFIPQQLVEPTDWLPPTLLLLPSHGPSYARCLDQEEESSTAGAAKSSISEEEASNMMGYGGGDDCGGSRSREKPQASKLHHCPRGHWRPSEDDKLREIVAEHGPQNWNLIAEKLQGRSGPLFSFPLQDQTIHIYIRFCSCHPLRSENLYIYISDPLLLL
jgi:hypothetical protein